MKITVYELIGLVKEGKQPNKIKYKGQEYTFFKEDEITDYCFKYNNGIDDWLSTHIGNEYIGDMFTNTVEIIEEPKKIEKSEPVRGSDLTDLTNKDIVLKNNALIELCKTLNNMNNKINELIEEINKLKEK